MCTECSPRDLTQIQNSESNLRVFSGYDFTWRPQKFDRLFFGAGRGRDQ